MFKNNGMLKTAILTTLVLFATIGLFTIVMAPGGITNSAHAFRSDGSGGSIGGGAFRLPCNIFACAGFE